MSVRIFPCFGCPLRDGCDERAGLARKVAGLGLRSAAFPCAKLGAEVRLGRRVVIKQPVLVGYDPDDSAPLINQSAASATITAVSSHYRFACTVDADAIPGVTDDPDGRRKRFRKTQAHWRIVRFLDEPDVPLCRNGNPVRNGQCDTPDGDCLCETRGVEMFTGWA